MKIAVLANDQQWKELTQQEPGSSWIRIKSLQSEPTIADTYLILEAINIEDLKKIQQPVILNSVVATLKELDTDKNVLRINGWNSFLQRKAWEVSGAVTEEAKQIFIALNKQYIETADEPGLVSARIIVMIINEAYFALAESVSTKNEIDIAMKLGTNYPYGPFEWAGIIGIKNVYDLLFQLSHTDKRYEPAPLLKSEANA